MSIYVRNRDHDLPAPPPPSSRKALARLLRGIIYATAIGIALGAVVVALASAPGIGGG